MFYSTYSFSTLTSKSKSKSLSKSKNIYAGYFFHMFRLDSRKYNVKEDSIEFSSANADFDNDFDFDLDEEIY